LAKEFSGKKPTQGTGQTEQNVSRWKEQE